MSDAKRQKLAMVPPPPPTPGSGVAALASLAATAASLSDRFATRLHVKNIAFSLSLAELRHFFAPWGVKVRVAAPRESLGEQKPQTGC